MADDLIAKVQDALTNASDLLEPALANFSLTEDQRQAARQIVGELKNWQFRFLDIRPEQLSDADRARLQDFLARAEQNKSALESANLSGGAHDFAAAIDRYRDAIGSLTSIGTHGAGDGEP